MKVLPTTIPVYCVINHKARLVYAYDRKMDSVYKHAEFKRGDRVEYREMDKLRLSTLKYKIVYNAS